MVMLEGCDRVEEKVYSRIERVSSWTGYNCTVAMCLILSRQLPGYDNQCDIKQLASSYRVVSAGVMCKAWLCEESLNYPAYFSGQRRPRPGFSRHKTPNLSSFPPSTFSQREKIKRTAEGARKERMDPVHSTYRSYAGSGGQSLEIVTTNPYRSSNDLFIHPTRHYLDATSPRQRPHPSPRKSRKHHIISSSSSSSSASASWWSNPEMKRKRRVVKYKLYAAEGKMKSSIKNGFRWIKRKCKKIVFGINY